MTTVMEDKLIDPRYVGILAFAVVISFGVSLVEPTISLAVIAALCIFPITLVSTQTALYLLIISMVFSPEITIGGAVGKGGGGRNVTLRLEDILLMVMGFTWLVKTAIYKNLPVFKWTPLNGPMLYYILICIFSTMIGMLTGEVTAKAGFFFVLKYFEYFFLFYMVVHQHRDHTEQ